MLVCTDAYDGSRTWTSLPATIPETKTLSAFKKQLQPYFISNPKALDIVLTVKFL